MADVIYLRLKSQDGFLGLHCLHDYDNGRYNWISHWDTKDDLNHSFNQVYPLFKEMIGRQGHWPPSVEIYSYYTPRNLEHLHAE
ncbi:antibiotic biosynthesis monooxygenase [Alicyclobacillus sp. SO9]|uniref:antibiotic biosynthesis monooxygenase family protein n=1 Tax=Alicyclobacillus sp. SO9 TaxID=2665646 RepID=UPI0018E7900D|nr:hypothetical protein [Alicyclobacillus sp. SO9]QQE77864.1 hypothetical protein GI364_18385 [Alicyclobacillus sp. SO9]